MEKKLALEHKRLQAQYPEALVEVWAMDEHRLGLKPIQRRVWVLYWRATDCRSQLAFPMVMVIWLC